MHLMIFGRLSLLFAMKHLTAVAVFASWFSVNSVSPTILLTSNSVCDFDSSMKMKPLMVVTNRNGGGEKGMVITVMSVVEMNF